MLSWSPQQDCVVSGVYASDFAVGSLDPDKTYSSWAASQVDGVVDEIFLFIYGLAPTSSARGCPAFLNLNIPLLKDQKIYISSAANPTLVQLMVEDSLPIFS